MRKVSLLLVVAMILTLGSASTGYAFRCGSNIVGVGDAKAKVLLECGPPTYKEQVGVKEESYGGESGRKRGSKTKKSKKVEQWTYNCGESDFIYILTFEGGKLIKEETAGRGRGRSDCGGR